MDGRATPDQRDAYSRYFQVKTFGSLDGLRAVAILVVVWHHAARPVPGWEITARGFLGVDLFFVISGFLIVTLLLRERRRTGRISLRDFYIRRFLRIFPPYYLMLLVVGTTAYLAPGSDSALVRRDLPYAVAYVSNLVPMQSMLAITWSLSVEEQFYLLVPTVEKYARRALPLLLPVVYLLACLPPFGLPRGLDFPDFFREATFGPVLLGVMLAHVLDDPRGHAWVSRALDWRLAPVVALAFALLAAGLPVGDISGWPRLAVHWSVLALVAACVIREENVLRPFLSLWPMRRIGIVSYGIYLYHLIVMHFVVKGLKVLGVSWGFAHFVATALATWAVAELSYRFFETRFLALKARFTRGAGRSEPAPAFAGTAGARPEPNQPAAGPP